MIEWTRAQKLHLQHMGEVHHAPLPAPVATTYPNHCPVVGVHPPELSSGMASAANDATSAALYASLRLRSVVPVSVARLRRICTRGESTGGDDARWLVAWNDAWPAAIVRRRSGAHRGEQRAVHSDAAHRAEQDPAAVCTDARVAHEVGGSGL